MQNNIIIYKTSEWQVKVLVQNENIWMNQEQIWELFWKDRSVISKHISNIYNEWELKQENKYFLILKQMCKICTIAS